MVLQFERLVFPNTVTPCILFNSSESESQKFIISTKLSKVRQYIIQYFSIIPLNKLLNYTIWDLASTNPLPKKSKSYAAKILIHDHAYNSGSI